MKLIQNNTTLMLAIALIFVGATMIFGPVFAQTGSDSALPAAVGRVDPVSVMAGNTARNDGSTDTLIRQSQANAQQNPTDSRPYSQLGVAYLQKTRETNDPAIYLQAEAAFKKALELDPKSYDAHAGLGSLELSRHNFTEALEWGRKAQVLAPARPFAYGVMGDAQIELGDYDAAINTFQQMVDLRPDLASYSRVSYARELHGDVEGAILAMGQAVQAGGLAAENTAWCRVQLGNLYFNSNRLAEAEQKYNEALGSYPKYLYGLVGLGQVRWSQGKVDEAISLYREAIADVPLPHLVGALGDLYALKGDKPAAKEQYDLAIFIYKTQETSGVDVDIERALFLADHDMEPQEAVRLARRAAETRNDVNTLDALGWSLYKAGQYTEALEAMQGALRLGTKNATFHFHMGMIYSKLGDPLKAKEHVQMALQINPNFSILHSENARTFVSN